MSKITNDGLTINVKIL